MALPQDTQAQDWFSAQGAPGTPVKTPGGRGDSAARPERGDFEPWDAFQARLTAWQAQQGAPVTPGVTPQPGAIQTAATQSSGGYNAPAPSGADPYAIIRQTMAGLPPTGASIPAIVAALNAAGIPATQATHGTRAHPQASDDAIVMPDGTYVDLIQGVGSPGAKWHSASGPSGQYDPTRSVIGADGQITTLNDFLSTRGLPGAPAYTAPKPGMTGLAGFAGGGAAGAEAALMSAPGFQFRIAEGQKALERSAAARGTLLTGGTLKAITRYGQDFASNEYNNRYNQLYGLSNLGLNAAGQSASLGAGYAGLSGNLNTSYANQAGATAANQVNTGTGLITSGANAQAAGTVGAANANAGALGGISQAAQQALLLWYLNGKQGPPPA